MRENKCKQIIFHINKSQKQQICVLLLQTFLFQISAWQWHTCARPCMCTHTLFGMGQGTGVCLSVWWIEEMSDELERDPIGWVSLSEINMFELQTFHGFRFQLKLQLRSCDHLWLLYPYRTIECSVYCKFVCGCVCVLKTKELSHYEYKLGTREASLLQQHLKICVYPW